MTLLGWSHLDLFTTIWQLHCQKTGINKHQQLTGHRSFWCDRLQSHCENIFASYFGNFWNLGVCIRCLVLHSIIIWRHETYVRWVQFERYHVFSLETCPRLHLSFHPICVRLKEVPSNIRENVFIEFSWNEACSFFRQSCRLFRLSDSLESGDYLGHRKDEISSLNTAYSIDPIELSFAFCSC